MSMTSKLKTIKFKKIINTTVVLVGWWAIIIFLKSLIIHEPVRKSALKRCLKTISIEYSERTKQLQNCSSKIPGLAKQGFFRDQRSSLELQKPLDKIRCIVDERELTCEEAQYQLFRARSFVNRLLEFNSEEIGRKCAEDYIVMPGLEKKISCASEEASEISRRLRDHSFNM